MADLITKMMRVCSVFFFLCLLQFCKIGAEQKLITMQCPEKFVDKAVNTITCTMNRLEIAKNCLSTANAVGFSIDRTPLNVGSGVLRLCSVELKDLGDCTATVQSGQCGCTKREGSLETYVFKYIGDMARDKGFKLICRLCVSGDPNVNLDPDLKTCESLQFVGPDTTTAALGPDTTTAARGASSGMKGGVLAAVVSIILTFCFCF